MNQISTFKIFFLHILTGSLEFLQVMAFYIGK